MTIITFTISVLAAVCAIYSLIVATGARKTADQAHQMGVWAEATAAIAICQVRGVDSGHLCIENTAGRTTITVTDPGTETPEQSETRAEGEGHDLTK